MKDSKLKTAYLRLRGYLGKASFSSQVDKLAAQECLEALADPRVRFYDAAGMPINPLPAQEMAMAIHWPDCWDTAAYPTLESALAALAASFRCTNQDTHHTITAKPLGDACHHCGWLDWVSQDGATYCQACGKPHGSMPKEGLPNLPELLRENADLDEAEGGNPQVCALERDAADEIERLRREVAKLRAPVAGERAAFEAWAKKKKMPLARVGQQYDDFWVDHAWNGWQARASVAAPAAGDARALLDHPLLRDVLGYIEDAGPADVWGAAQSWMALRDAASQQQEG